MCIIRNVIKIIIFVSLFLFLIPVIDEIKINEKVDELVDSKKRESIFEGLLYIPKFNYKNVIKKGVSALDDNNIEMLDFSDSIGGNRIVLAGHNNRYVFNKLYYLDINDEIVLSDSGKDYKYLVRKTKYIDTDDFSDFNIDNSLILITCTYDNQKRFIVILEKV
ncbi:MAG: sortase [Bacilli bacterium]|nr:sortase [Bacilli bacterium]